MTALIFNRKTIALWLVGAFVCTMAGPFGTGAAPLVVRGPYWFVSTALAIGLSTPIFVLGYRCGHRVGLPSAAVTVLAGLAFGALFAGLSTPLLRAFFGADRASPGFGELFLYAAPIAVVIGFLVDLFRTPEPEPDAAPAPANGAARILDRLKPALGRDLVRMSMQDHYVEVTTTSGSQLILLRFADALAEADGVPGWRIHRSHWVAEAGIADLRREGERTFIDTTDGASLPVSRTYLPVLREAGLIARFR